MQQVDVMMVVFTIHGFLLFAIAVYCIGVEFYKYQPDAIQTRSIQIAYCTINRT